MGTTRLALHLDNASRIFYPGQVVTGQVAFVNESSLKVKGLTLTFYGEAEVYWTESEVQADTVSPHRNNGSSQSVAQTRRHIHKEYRNHETFLCEEIVLFGQEAEGGNDMVIPAGIQAYPFTFRLPTSGLPSSYIGSPFGFVKYTVEARLKRPMFRYDKMEHEFFVNGILDLNFIPNSTQPFATNDRADFGWLCCDEGYTAMDLNLERIGYLPGERLEFSAAVLNFSRNVVRNVRVSFAQFTDFKTFDRDKRLMKKLKEIVYPPVGGGGVERWNDGFTIPNVLLPTNLAGCRIIGLVYVIMIEATVSNKLLNLTAPVIIGTEPCPLPIAPPGVESLATGSSSTLAIRTPVENHPPLLKLDSEGNKEHDDNNAVPHPNRKGEQNTNPFLEDEAEDGLITNNNIESDRNREDSNSVENSVIMSDDDGLQN